VKKRLSPKAYQAQAIPPTNSPTSTPSSSVLDQFYTFDERPYEVQEIMEKLEYILAQHTHMLDGIAHNQAIVDMAASARVCSIDKSIVFRDQSNLSSLVQIKNAKQNDF